MKFLITGGAGYIGTNLANYLLKENHQVVIADNLELGNKELVPKKAKLYVADLRDKRELEKIFIENKIDAVFHLASYSLVDESMKTPGKYFDNNIISTLNLLDLMVKFNVKYHIFSSSVSVYGNPEKLPIDENQLLLPSNVYGQTKKIAEEILSWYDKIYGIRFVSLRYFNAAGDDYGIGEKRKNETHLIPLLFKAALGSSEYFTIFGNDYPTKDGTAVRDYVHVTDLSKAHLLSFNYLEDGNKSEVFNLGSGVGKSVKEIVKIVEQITGNKIAIKIEERRKGDPAILIADYSKARKVLKWNPQKNIKEIITDVYGWYKE
ncbi:MAG: UDP-glucose 4-epimerase GalE [Candidatus Pacebacteria bacterium]|nr:UDP-glucose 4-epimerase GalE [Candidatus Paceibacterota bacterium]